LFGAEWSVQVVDLSLPSHADVTLYIDLRPVLPLEAYTTGDVRELVGGQSHHLKLLRCY
jgi:hypothetical protein